LASELMTRTCNQRSLDTEVVDWLELAGAAADCAKTPNGERARAAVAMRAVLAKKLLLRSDMTGGLLWPAQGRFLEIGTRGEQGKFPLKGGKWKVQG